jgi:hypothetical protein
LALRVVRISGLKTEEGMGGWQRNIWTEDRGRDGRLAEKYLD